MASSDWLDVNGWLQSMVGWSMDQTHDLLPNKEYGLGPIGSVNPKVDFHQSSPHLRRFSMLQ